jgi:hypothetical protein
VREEYRAILLNPLLLQKMFARIKNTFNRKTNSLSSIVAVNASEGQNRLCR